MRKGIYTFDPKKFMGLKPVLKYVGLHVSNTIISFVYVLFLIGFITFPIFWPLFWIILWDYLPAILIIIIPALITVVLKIIAKCIVVSQHFVKIRRYSFFFNQLMIN